MKVTDFLGKRVVDRKAMEIGKVADVIIDPLDAVITGIIISTGEFGLRRTDLYITPSQVEEVGDYVLLKIERFDVKEHKEQAKEEKEKTTIKL